VQPIKGRRRERALAGLETGERALDLLTGAFDRTRIDRAGRALEAVGFAEKRFHQRQLSVTVPRLFEFDQAGAEC